MHGEHLNAWCMACDVRSRWTGSLLGRPLCPECGEAALRPDVVWFGVVPYHMDEIFAALRSADLFVSIGTSGAVYPAAGFERRARDTRAATLELNLAPRQSTPGFATARHGPATPTLPAWAGGTLAGAAATGGSKRT